MIPYDDLVARLQSWRARNGLPVTAAAAAAPTLAVQDDIPAEQLEVIDDDYYHRNPNDDSLQDFGANEATPIGDVPKPPRRPF